MNKKYALIIAILILILVISFEIVLFIKSQSKGLDSKLCKCNKIDDSTIGRVYRGKRVEENDLNYAAAVLKETIVPGKCKYLFLTKIHNNIYLDNY